MGRIYSIIFLFCFYNIGELKAQTNLTSYAQFTEKEKMDRLTYAVNNNSVTSQQIESLNLEVVHKNATYIYVRSTAMELEGYVKNGVLQSFIVDSHPPVLLADSVRFYHSVNQVHEGLELQNSYKGTDVIVGFIDTGIDYNHPDFQFENGNSRILRIWDQTMSSQPPVEYYGYGAVFTNNDIDNDLCPHQDNDAHGTTVAGIAVGNGFSCGENQGVAPEANIIMVKYNGAGPAWSSRVTDGIEYIFKVADSLGKRAVVNVSLGTYFGSHDGMDASSLRAVDLLDEKSGRLLVTACGNSGNIGKYHAGTSFQNEHKFTLLRSETSTNIGPDRVYLDGYTPLDSVGFRYSIIAVNPLNNYELRASSDFHFLFHSNNAIITDTLRSSLGNILAIARLAGQIEGVSYHFSVNIQVVDSINYRYGFLTKDSGRWDVWSGKALGYNYFVEEIADGTMFEYGRFVAPDLKQSIVSGWTCHPKIISVGNIRNRFSFETLAGTVYTVNDGNEVSQLSINSSKGPNRLQEIKPDVVAKGDVILTAGPIAFMNAHPEKVTLSGWHMTNGGTSMASPVIAAIGALYLERCEEGNQAGFLELLKQTSKPNVFSGVLPNTAYGYGYADAWDLIKKSERNPQVIGSSVLCDENEILVENQGVFTNVVWENNEDASERLISTLGEYYYSATNQYGCEVHSDTLNVNVQGQFAIVSPIIADFLTQQLVTSGAIRYQWYRNGELVEGATTSILPFIFNGVEMEGAIKVFGFSTEGCVTESEVYNLNLSTAQLLRNFTIHPNPTREKLYITTDYVLSNIEVYDATGRQVYVLFDGSSLDVSALYSGVYVLKMNVEGQNVQTKIVIQ